MQTKRELTRDKLKNILQAENIETLTLEKIKQYILNEGEIGKFAPDGICQIDPRNGDRIVYSTVRARRPHDNRSAVLASDETESEKDCLICQGKTTKVIDKADLSEGFTFVNKNLFPIFYPANKSNVKSIGDENTYEDVKGCEVSGYHFLQWTSSYHDKDWQNMPLGDREIVMRRLAALEKKIVEGSEMFVSIIKNYGQLVGGSLVHGHQQIGASNIMPNRCIQDKKFKEDHGETFSAYMIRENPAELVIKDYGSVVLITPYFMRRPYDMQLLIKDTEKAYIHLLNKNEIAAIADGWRDAIRIMLSIMPQIGKETAYNITTHNGPGAGLYFEFLPYTQEMGGFEHLGLFLCQGNPHQAAAQARECLSEYSEKEGESR